MPNNRDAIKGVIQGYEVYNKFWNYFTPLYLPWKMARFPPKNGYDDNFVLIFINLKNQNW